MKKTFLLFLISFFILMKVSLALEIPTDKGPLQLRGVASASMHYLTHPRNTVGNTGIGVNDLIVHVGKENATEKQLSFFAGIGALEQQDFQFTRVPLPPLNIGLQYGWFSLQTNHGIRWQLGQLISQLGYESIVSAENDNIFHGQIWTRQPAHYPGVRWIFEKYSNQIYFEINGAPESSGAAYALGVQGKYQLLNYKINGFFTDEKDDIYDLTLKASFKHIDIGSYLNIHQIPDQTGNDDPLAVAAALYLVPKKGRYSLPIRIEVIKEGRILIYRYDEGFTVTVTPSIDLSPTTFFRTEFVYAWGEASPFRHEDSFVKTQIAIAFQLGMRF